MSINAIQKDIIFTFVALVIIDTMRYLSWVGATGGGNWKMFSAKDYANEIIYRQLFDKRPCMIARFGAIELNCLVNYLCVNNKKNIKIILKVRHLNSGEINH